MHRACPLTCLPALADLFCLQRSPLPCPLLPCPCWGCRLMWTCLEGRRAAGTGGTDQSQLCCCRGGGGAARHLVRLAGGLAGARIGCLPFEEKQHLVAAAASAPQRLHVSPLLRLVPLLHCAAAGSEAELAGEPTTPRGGSHDVSRPNSPAPPATDALSTAALRTWHSAGERPQRCCWGLRGEGIQLHCWPPALQPCNSGLSWELFCGCFSWSSAGGELPSTLSEEPAGPLLPAGTTGIRNIGKQLWHLPLLAPFACLVPVVLLADRQAWHSLMQHPSRLPTSRLLSVCAGNTCFVNAALQCLRYTPGLPLQVVPDLLQRAAELQQDQQRQAAGAGSEAAANGSGAAEPAAGGDCQQQTQQQVEEAAAPAAEDVHQQALARASVDLSPEEVARARLALEQAAAAAGAAAEGGGAIAVSDAAAPAEAAAADGAEAGAGHVAEQPVVATAAPQPQAVAKPQRPPKGALLEAFAALVQELYLKPATGPAVCAAPMLRTLRAFPIAGIELRACLPALHGCLLLPRPECSCVQIRTCALFSIASSNLLLLTLRFPHLPAADYFDGGQHDCQEVLRVLMDLLHDDLVSRRADVALSWHVGLRRVCSG